MVIDEPAGDLGVAPDITQSVDDITQAAQRGAGEAEDVRTDLLALDRLGVQIDVRRPLSTLNIALQQMVAVETARMARMDSSVSSEPPAMCSSSSVPTIRNMVIAPAPMASASSGEQITS